MKLHPPATVLCIVAAGLGITAAMKREPAPLQTEPRCAVLRSYVELLIRDGEPFDGKKPVLVVQETRATMISHAEELAKPDTPPSVKSGPLVPLYLQLDRTSAIEVKAACPLLFDGLESFSWAPEDHDFIRGMDIDEEFKEIAFALSLPAISQDGRQALFNVGMTFGPLAGAGMEVLMQKDRAGNWQILSQNRTWIS